MKLQLFGQDIVLDKSLVAELESRNKIKWLLRKTNVFGRVFRVVNDHQFSNPQFS